MMFLLDLLVFVSDSVHIRWLFFEGNSSDVKELLIHGVKLTDFVLEDTIDTLDGHMYWAEQDHIGSMSRQNI